MNTRLWISFCLACCFVVAGCTLALAVTRSGQTATDYERLFDAAQQAALAQHFKLVSADISSGLITGQGTMVSGLRDVTVWLNIKISRGLPNSVEISVVPPPATLGNVDGIVRRLFAALKSRVPDLSGPN